MFLWCFGRRKPSTSSIGGACKMSRNPFRIDIVTEIMLEEADVDTLKTLREMNSFWNKLDLKELEKRAMKGQLEGVYIADTDQNWLDEFLEDSSAIPQLFPSFKLEFPTSFQFIHSFFPKYTPKFLQLEFFEGQLTKDVTAYLQSFFTWTSPTLQELKLRFMCYPARDQVNLQILHIPQTNGLPLVFPELTKLTWMADIPSHYHIPFKFILDKSGTLDPTPNLTTLEAKINNEFLRMLDNVQSRARWSQLTNLKIICCRFLDNSNLPATLLNLAQAGMRLKAFALTYYFSPLEGSPEFAEIWSQFFAMQSKTLEVLELDWFLCKEDAGDMVDPEINLPIFERLHTLHLCLEYKVYPLGGPVLVWMFRMIQIPVHFPKLDTLRVNQQGFFNIFPLDGEPISLKTLEFHHNSKKLLQAWDCKFPPSVESFKCEGRVFEAWGTEIPWKESIKVLEINRLNFPLELSDFTSLRVLIVTKWSPWNKLDPEYLSFFEQVLTLKLSCIIFKSRQEAPDCLKTRFIRHFPFPVKFERMTMDLDLLFHM